MVKVLGGVNVTSTSSRFSWTPSNPVSDRHVSCKFEVLNEKWHHFVFCINYLSKEKKVYIDGVSYTTTIANTPIDWTPAARYNNYKIDAIGARFINKWCFFKGMIDDIMLFNRCLSDEEVLTLHNGYIPPLPCTNDWHCLESKLIYDYENSQVIIGTDELHSDYLFGVNGKIKTREVLVTIDNWPDYVFKNEYKLKPLNQLENYITINKHLPNVPSEKEVKEEGISLGEMNAKLLEKIEELTLYIIEQNKKTEKLEMKLKTQIEQLNNQNKKLEDRLKQLEVID